MGSIIIRGLEMELNSANHQLEQAVKITNNLQADKARLRGLLKEACGLFPDDPYVDAFLNKPEIKELMEGKC